MAKAGELVTGVPNRSQVEYSSRMMLKVDPNQIWKADRTKSAPDNVSYNTIQGEHVPLPYVMQPLLLSQKNSQLELVGPYMGAAEHDSENLYAQLRRIATQGNLRIMSIAIPDMNEPKDGNWPSDLRAYAISADDNLIEPGGKYQAVLPLAFTSNDYCKRAVFLRDIVLNVNPPNKEGMFEDSPRQPADGYLERNCNTWVDLSAGNPVLFTLDPNIALGVVAYLEQNMPLIEKTKLVIRRWKTT